MISKNSTEARNPTSAMTFLGAVAHACMERYQNLTDVCFVFPGKRAGTFLMREIQKNAGSHIILAPEIKTIADFMETVSDRILDSRVDLILRLYEAYRSYMHQDGYEADMLDFDTFHRWGDTLLSDFNEVDLYNVDPEEVFKNVKDFREITSDFLTEEQREIMQRYFGYTPDSDGVSRFWRNFDNDRNDLSRIKQKFLRLWQIMAPLYRTLSANLEAEGLAMTGGAWRRTLQVIEESGTEMLPWKKVFFVGFNALSTVEAMIFEKLAACRSRLPGHENEPYAEFFWDIPGVVLEDRDNPAAFYMQQNLRNLPMPEWADSYMKRCRYADIIPEITIHAAPSNAAQAKIAGKRVTELADQLGSDYINEAKVAVVLPDDGLMLPLLSSLRDDIGKINLTMGYGMRQAAVVPFIYHLRRLHKRRRRINDSETGFYHADLRTLLSHPYTHRLAGSDNLAKLTRHINKHHLYTVSLEVIRQYSSELADVLRQLDRNSPPAMSVAYLDDLLQKIDEVIARESKEENNPLRGRIERAHITLYRDALRRLNSTLEQHNVSITPEGVFKLADELLSGEMVSFEGEPLEGLQIMGVLETRSLDFDYVIIPSLNDKQMPSRFRRRTFIPDSLRQGYGLPGSNHQETLFSYYFYRLLGRARKVDLIYDARSGEGMRSGGLSRYLYQLQYIYGRDKVNICNYRYLVASAPENVTPVIKNESVMAELAKFSDPSSGRNFSASVLKNYMDCGLRFYYSVVKNIKTDPEPNEYIDAITKGNIIHDVMLHLYFPAYNQQRRYLDKPIVLTRDDIMSIRRNSNLLRREVIRAVNRKHFYLDEKEIDAPLHGTAEIVADRILYDIDNILRADMRQAPITLLGAEFGQTIGWRTPSGRRVNMKYVIDRLDIPDGHNRRIVDYKTGGSYVNASEMESIFSGAASSKNLFQLLLYAELLNVSHESRGGSEMCIYEVDSIGSDGPVIPVMTDKESQTKIKIANNKQVSAQFVERLNEMIEEIYDADKPFMPTSDDSHCDYCTLNVICGKLKK